MEIKFKAISEITMETSTRGIKQTTTEVVADDAGVNLRLDHDIVFACESWLNTVAVATSTMIMAAVKVGIATTEDEALNRFIEGVKAFIDQRDASKIKILHDGKLN